MTRYVTTLRCAACGQECEHALTYVGNLLYTTSCGGCGAVLRAAGPGYRHRYLSDLEGRVLSKPERMAQRFRAEPVRFLVTLPWAIARQPPKFLKEWWTILRT